MRAVLISLTEGIRIGLASLRVNRLRTFLTLLGNIVAMMSVMAVVSVLSGIDVYFREQVAQEGSNTITVRRVDFFTLLNDFEGVSEARHNPALDLDDVAFLRRFGLEQAAFIGARASGQIDLTRGTRTVSAVTVHGRTVYYPFIDDLSLQRGRHFSMLEDERGRAVIVLGSELAEELFGPIDPIDRNVIMGGRHLRVVGVLAKRPSVLGNNPNRQAVVPIRFHQKILGGSTVEIPIKAASVAVIDELVDDTRLAMRVRRRLKPSDRENFGVDTAAALVEFWRKIAGIIFSGLVGIVAVSLVVGGVVVMNTMLVSVTERTREIGLRKALGASNRDLGWQFLFEAATLSTIGGAMGIGLGFVIALLVSILSPLPYAVQAPAIVAGLAVTMGVGLVFGVYPARRAARMDPVEALRHE